MQGLIILLLGLGVESIATSAEPPGELDLCTWKSGGYQAEKQISRDATMVCTDCTFWFGVHTMPFSVLKKYHNKKKWERWFWNGLWHVL